ncbi:MAG: hypothetical protein J7M34_05035, partial [Anaerolineae bacterium]|nr:hypothetical protein [Anaerolineae bacterium]
REPTAIPFNDVMLTPPLGVRALRDLPSRPDAGLLNTLAHVRRVFGQKIVAIFGGTHLSAADRSSLKEVARVLEKEYDAPELYLNHCTGERAYVHMIERFGEAVHVCPAGTRVAFP